jgi:hypothetical protein
MDGCKHSPGHSAAIALMTGDIQEKAYGMLIHDPFSRDKIDYGRDQKNPEGH